MKKLYTILSYYLLTSILAIVFALSADLNAGSLSTVEEYTLKAAFLERFSRFVEWPGQSAVNDPGKPFIIGVIGKNPFGSLLEHIYMKRNGENKKIKIKYFLNEDEISECHLLFICGSEAETLPVIISKIQNRNILTVSDTPGFAREGVHINMYRDKTRIRFEINPNALKKSGLHMSHLLLRMARIVK